MKRTTIPLIALFLFVACAGGGSATPAAPTAGAGGPEAKRTVVWLEGIGQDPSVSEPYANEIVADFTKRHPDIELKREAVRPDQLRAIIEARLRSNNPPDVFGYDTGPRFGGMLARAGLLYDLSNAYGKFRWKHFAWAKQRCMYAGKISCLPDQVQELGIYYNKKLFEAKGFQEPRSLAELERYADAFKADNIIPFAYGNGGDDSWTSGQQFSMFASNLLGRTGLDDRLYGSVAWNSPEVVKAIDIFFRQWVDKGYFPPSPTGLGYNDANALFYDQNAAMLPTGTWLVSDIAQRATFEVGFFPLPAVDGSRVSPPAILEGGLFMAANSKDPDAALVVMDYLHSVDRMRTRMERQSAIPAIPIETSGLKVSPLFQEVVKDLAESSGTANSFGYNIDALTPARFKIVMAEGFQEVMNGRRTPQQQADALDKAYQDARKAGEALQNP